MKNKPHTPSATPATRKNSEVKPEAVPDLYVPTSKKDNPNKTQPQDN